ncbi:hypothetical protein MtrunA17_Chr8g0367731 [Medicago truncatula]|uniref:RNase H type-1 domain-containing protein n=1 Tax=Medicago truncatula TaxID=3880 RepID=A0A396GKE9_MEDTR|nr:hypothetical protein MtrunA17_Chr8g0367731 [Medicago truncatula]
MNLLQKLQFLRKQKMPLLRKLPAPHGLKQQFAADDSSAYVPAASVIAEPHQIKWQPPASGRFKCNVDAAFSIPHNRTGVGICLWDDEGTFVLAKTVHGSIAGSLLGCSVAFGMFNNHDNFKASHNSAGQ